MGNLLTVPPEFVTCNCSNNATYRCQYSRPIHQDFFYHMSVTQERLEQDFDDPDLIKVLLRLRPYWHSSGSNEVQWVACEKCIRPDVEKYFTKVPKGWSKRIKDHINYEPIKM
jgi:hypothetical protein